MSFVMLNQPIQKYGLGRSIAEGLGVGLDRGMSHAWRMQTDPAYFEAIKDKEAIDRVSKKGIWNPDLLVSPSPPDDAGGGPPQIGGFDPSKPKPYGLAAAEYRKTKALEGMDPFTRADKELDATNAKALAEQTLNNLVAQGQLYGAQADELRARPTIQAFEAQNKKLADALDFAQRRSQQGITIVNGSGGNAPAPTKPEKPVQPKLQPTAKLIGKNAQSRGQKDNATSFLEAAQENFSNGNIGLATSQFSSGVSELANGVQQDLITGKTTEEMAMVISDAERTIALKAPTTEAANAGILTFRQLLKTKVSSNAPKVNKSWIPTWAGGKGFNPTGDNRAAALKGLLGE